MYCTKTNAFGTPVALCPPAGRQSANLAIVRCCAESICGNLVVRERPRRPGADIPRSPSAHHFAARINRAKPLYALVKASDCFAAVPIASSCRGITWRRSGRMMRGPRKSCGSQPMRRAHQLCTAHQPVPVGALSTLIARWLDKGSKVHLTRCRATVCMLAASGLWPLITRFPRTGASRLQRFTAGMTPPARRAEFTSANPAGTRHRGPPAARLPSSSLWPEGGSAARRLAAAAMEMPVGATVPPPAGHSSTFPATPR